MKKAFTLPEIIIAVGIMVIIASIAIVNIIRSARVANAHLAWSTLASISSALEMHNNVNGAYPTSLAVLVGSQLPNISQDFCGKSVRGYSYQCELAPGSYTITASPVSREDEDVSGVKLFTLATGGIISETTQDIIGMRPSQDP
ncbi:MAG: prepilin-type N-terminal cleavage/methylation domain-containing protein [Candidatus Omnitrophota bacterium]|nr:prepilin-type N-terminal cleavage/methylation domain-containing protein [Candidatus Omnitrophota bacterium]